MARVLEWMDITFMPPTAAVYISLRDNLSGGILQMTHSARFRQGDGQRV